MRWIYTLSAMDAHDLCVLSDRAYSSTLVSKCYTSVMFCHRVPCILAICAFSCNFRPHTLPQTSHTNVLKSPITPWTTAICLSQLSFLPKALSQISQLKTVTSPCRWTAAKCLFKTVLWLNCREQRSHLKLGGVSSIPCAFAWWNLSCDFSANFLPQMSHSWLPVPRSDLRRRVGWPCLVP